MTDMIAPGRAPGGSRVRAILPYAVAVLLFAAGIYALYRLLAPVNLREVMDQVRATPPTTLVVAILCTFGGYAALVGYDWSALRYLGKYLPPRVVALGGFLGYAFGNTIGLSAVSGGAVRYRIYSALGLSPYDIAAIATFASLAFGIGITIVGLGALVVHPMALQSIISMSPQVIRWTSLLAFVVLLTILFVLAARKQTATFGTFTVAMPSVGIVAGQIVFTLIDICLAATVLYILLPPNDIGFLTFLAVFAVAGMAGVLSHVPGGIGVFESVVIAALPSSIPVSQAAAALLLYRLIYYLVPFAIALVLLSLNEARMALSKTEGAPEKTASGMQPAFAAVSSIVPLAMAAMVFGSGVWMLISALIPGTSDAADELELLLPLVFVEAVRCCRVPLARYC